MEVVYTPRSVVGESPGTEAEVVSLPTNPRSLTWPMTGPAQVDCGGRADGRAYRVCPSSRLPQL
eukprot:6527608-Pyramimonas_sp.AAC.1